LELKIGEGRIIFLVKNHKEKTFFGKKKQIKNLEVIITENGKLELLFTAEYHTFKSLN
jgi:hypothetical protein